MDEKTQNALLQITNALECQVQIHKSTSTQIDEILAMIMNLQKQIDMIRTGI